MYSTNLITSLLLAGLLKPVISVPAAAAAVVYDYATVTAMVTVMQLPDGSFTTIAPTEASSTPPPSTSSSATPTPSSSSPATSSTSSSYSSSSSSNEPGEFFAENQSSSSSESSSSSSIYTPPSSTSQYGSSVQTGSSYSTGSSGSSNGGGVPSGGDGSSGQSLTISLTNAHTATVTVAFGGGSSMETTLPPGSDAQWVLGTSASANMGVAVKGVPDPVASGSLFEYTYQAGGSGGYPPLNLDVSFVNSYSVPMSVSAGGVTLGCIENSYLEDCPESQQVKVDGEVAACLNPTGGSASTGATPFTEGTCPAAYKYWSDNLTDKGVSGSLAYVCIGTACPAINYVGDAAKRDLKDSIVQERGAEAAALPMIEEALPHSHNHRRHLHEHKHNIHRK